MIDFDYDALAALAAVAKEGSFEAAARALNVTQSAVSQRIKQLEERLGAILIIRGRPCVATEFGLHLIRHVDHVSVLEHDLKRLIGPGAGGPENRGAVLKIVANSDSLSTWFPKVIRRAWEEIQVHLEILADDQEHSSAHLKSGEVFAALTASADPIQGFRLTALGAMEYLAVSTVSFKAKYFPDGVTAQEVRVAPSLVFDRKDNLPHQWLEQALGEKITLHGSMIPSYEGYLACCLNGSGWGMMPRETVAAHVRAGRLVELIPNTQVETNLFWQTSNKGTEVFRKLSEIVQEEAAKSLRGQGAPIK